MQKAVLIIIASFLLFFIVFPKHVVFAADSSQSAGSSQSAAVSPTGVPDYVLPYPGILPDNPFYFLKVLRDRLILFFISNPTKKSSFYLLQSDKRLEASWYLLRRSEKDQPLAVSTLSKSTNYLSQSLGAAQQAQQNGDDVSDLRSRLQSAIAKHVAIVGMMLHLPGISQIDGLNQEEKRLIDLQKAVEDFGKK